MAWDNAVVTNQGVALLLQVLDGKKLWLDHAGGGTGTVPPDTLMQQTALVDQKQRFSIISAINVDDGKKVGGLITNIALETGYQMTQYGIWAHIEGGDPVLMAILQDPAGLPIPSRTELPEFTLTFYAIIDFSNEAQWYITIDPTGLVSMASMSAAITVAVNNVMEALALGLATKQNKIMATGLLKGLGDGVVVSAKPGEDFTAATILAVEDPEETTPGALGQFYVNKDSGELFVLIAIDDDVYTWLSTGGGGGRSSNMAFLGNSYSGNAYLSTL